MTRVETIGDATLHLGDCREILPTLAPFDHTISDPPYEAIMHASKDNMKGLVRPDGSHHWKPLGFDSIDEIRADVVNLCGPMTGGWFIVFCTSEGVGRWADEINASPMKYKRACVWVKPDSTPQMNGQGPAQGAEHFVCAWAGKGFAKWNAGGKRGVYTHSVNAGRQGEHPTEKPASLMAELVTDFTMPGQTICDPFMGSGTTGVACGQLGRRFIGIEKDPRWFDLSCRRIEAAYRQPRLFAEPIPKPVQPSLIGEDA